LTKRIVAPAGLHTRSDTSATDLPIADAVIAWNAAGRSAGFSNPSAVPSRVDATFRSSPATQSAPTPRLSQMNRPSQASSTRCRSSGRSCWFCPSVSRMACFTSAGWLANR
jgi:hypothetical protein